MTKGVRVSAPSSRQGTTSARPVTFLRIIKEKSFCTAAANNSPIRFLGVVDAAVVPHAHVRRAGVVADVALEQLLQNTIWDGKPCC